MLLSACLLACSRSYLTACLAHLPLPVTAGAALFLCRLFQRLMSPEGPNLRRYYLPGLEHLKIELSCFELLLSSHQPLLHQHLLDGGLPALLYAAQWLMTTYSCPFPMHVSGLLHPLLAGQHKMHHVSVSVLRLLKVV